MDNITLSIIIPCSGERYRYRLNHCLSSIERQQMDRDCYEVIVVDDNHDTYGIGGLRNIGLRKASGKYTMFVDADDCIIDNRLKECLELMESHELDMLSFGFVRDRADYAVCSDNISEPEFFDSGAEYMATHNFFGSAWRHIMRTKWLMGCDIRFAENVTHEDEAFVAKCYAMAGKTAVWDKHVYVYSKYSDSVILRKGNEYRRKRIDDFRLMLNDLQDFRTKSDILSKRSLEAIDRRLRFLTIDYTIQMIRNGCGVADIRRRLAELRDANFLPLPDAGYSGKYNFSRRVINLLTPRTTK